MATGDISEAASPRSWGKILVIKWATEKLTGKLEDSSFPLDRVIYKLENVIDFLLRKVGKY